MQKRRGFTIIEMITVILVGAILVTIAFSAFGTVSRRYSAREARNSFEALHARSRAQAIEYGQTIEFRAEADGDSIWIERNDSTLEKIRLMNQFGVDLMSNPASVTLCLNSRGYGDEDCSDVSTAVTFAFATSSDTISIEMLPLGQLVR